MAKLSISKEEQLRAIWSGDRDRLAQTHCDGDLLALSQMWTVSHQEIHDFFRARGVPSWSYRDTADSQDGVYMVASDDTVHVYQQDRGFKMWEERFASREEAEQFLVEVLFVPRPLRQQ